MDTEPIIHQTTWSRGGAYEYMYKPLNSSNVHAKRASDLPLPKHFKVFIEKEQAKHQSIEYLGEQVNPTLQYVITHRINRNHLLTEIWVFWATKSGHIIHTETYSVHGENFHADHLNYLNHVESHIPQTHISEWDYTPHSNGSGPIKQHGIKLEKSMIE